MTQVKHQELSNTKNLSNLHGKTKETVTDISKYMEVTENDTVTAQPT